MKIPKNSRQTKDAYLIQNGKMIWGGNEKMLIDTWVVQIVRHRAY